MRDAVCLPNIFVGRTPAQTLVEIDGSHSWILADLAFPGEDTILRIDSQTLTGIEKIEVILDDSRLGKVYVGSKGSGEAGGPFHFVRY